MSSPVNSGITPLVKQARIMARKYDVVCTNPPYMNKFGKDLKKYIQDNYQDCKFDLFSVFIWRNFDFCKPNGYSGFMSPFVWMFIKSYEKLREYIIREKCIQTLIQMEYSAFEEATVPICAFVLRNSKLNYAGNYLRLSDFKGGMEVQDKKVMEAQKDPNCQYRYYASLESFGRIPGLTIAYWMSPKLIDAFSGQLFGIEYDCFVGMRTGDNDRFLRLWYEVDVTNTQLKNATVQSTTYRKWVPYLKGGEFRRWYYNYDYVVNWKNNGEEIKVNTRRKYPQLGENLSWKITSEPEYFKPGITFNAISSSTIGFKLFDSGAIFSNASHAILHADRDMMYYALGFLNTCVVSNILSILSPTINYTPSDMKKIPIIHDKAETVMERAQSNEQVSRLDWDSFETSWEFQRHPMI